MIASEDSVKTAAKYLTAHDPVLGAVVAVVGPCTIRPHRNYYQELVDSIISQQLSIKAASTIQKRFCELFGSTELPAPELILTKDIDELHTAGLSRGKATYVRDLAQRVVDGKIKFNNIDNLTNNEVIAELTTIKGVGEWTAHMFLMFCMGRMDVLAHGDLGVKNGIQKLYGLDHQPTRAEIVALAAEKQWHPYESIACWYIWQSLDNMPAA